MKKLYLLAAAAIVAFAGCNQQLTEEQIKEKAAEIHSQVLTVDTHTDTPLNFLDPDFDISKWNDLDETYSRIDFPRMKAGGMDAVFMAVFIGQGERTHEGNERAKSRALEIFDAMHTMLKENKDVAELALTPDDAYQLEKEGKRAIYIGVENGYPIGSDIAMVEKFYDLGARYITLSHTRNNDICDSSTDDPEHDGLTDFGEEVVKEMNKLGMMIDVSHISDKSFYDVLELTEAPVIASHSCARAICDHPRNLNDSMLVALKENGGVIQMCILSDYLKTPDPNPARDSAFASLRKKYNNFEDLSEEQRAQAGKEWRQINRDFPRVLASTKELVDHIDHVVNVIGVDYVGIGTDFDGGGGLSDVRDVSEMQNITIELVRRGYTEQEIEKIWGGNVMRVFNEVQKKREV